VRFSFILREAGLWLGLGYLLLLGGTQIGVVIFELNVVTLGLLALAFSGWAVWRWRARPPAPALFAPLLLAVGLQFVTALASLDPERSLGAVWFSALALGLYVVVSDVIAAGVERARLVRYVLVLSSVTLAGGVLEAVPFYARWISLLGWRGLLPPVNFRSADAGVLAILFNLLIPFALVWLGQTRRWAARLALGAWLAGALLVVFFTSSRGGWLGLAAGIGMMILLALVRGGGAWLRAQVAGWNWRQWSGVGLAALALAAGGGALLIRQGQGATHAGAWFDARTFFWAIGWKMFQTHPLLGQGPNTYATTFAALNPIPPQRLWVHAHNILINVLGESGLLGAAAFSLVAFSAVRAFWRKWRGADWDWLTLAAAGALAALAVHGLTDTVTSHLPAGLLLPALMAVGLARRAERSPAARPILPLLLGAAVTAAGLWTLWGYAAYHRGVSALNAGDVPAAVRELDAARARNPWSSLFALQAGLARGAVAAGDPAQLAAAFADYEFGTRHEPGYSVNWANLAVLYQQAGRVSEAEAAWAAAGPAAEVDAFDLLNRGLLAEAAGQLDAARERYRAALTAEPEWAAAYFFRQTDFRRALAADWRQSARGRCPAAASAPTASDGWLCWYAGDVPAAEQLFAQAKASGVGPAYIGHALAAMALGDYSTAELELAAADSLPNTGRMTVWLQFAHGDWAAHLGRTDEAREWYRQAAFSLLHPTAYGPGSYGSTPYPWTVFRREGPFDDLLPQAARITATDATAPRLLQLGAWYSAAGDDAAARALYAQILEAIPDNAEAAWRLAAP
jgi:O-antigen ligase/Tfp pilus assembly protein PilF